MNWMSSTCLAGAMMVASLMTATSAEARVKREGAWPDADKAVTLDVDGMPRREALRKLADVVGWSVVVHAPPGDPVDVHVKGQPAFKVLEILLDDGDYTVKRDGTLLSIERLAAEAGAPSTSLAPPVLPAPPAPPAPPALPGAPPAPPAPPALPGASAAASAPSAVRVHKDKDDDDDDDDDDVKIELGNGQQIHAPHKRGADRTVMGGAVRVPKGEQVRDLTVFGGTVDIEGEVSADLTVFGGSVHLHPGAKVDADASVFGGKLQLDRGSRVDGDVTCGWGELQRDPGAIVGGDVKVEGGRATGDSHVEAHEGVLRRAWGSFLDGVRLAAVLFVIGTVLVALAGRRMDQLRLEVVTRPMRSVAMGLVYALTSVVVLVALCITVIGIPVAAVVAVLAGFGVLGAMCAVLSVVGEGLLRHKTENPYVHLAAGCALFVAVSAIPWVGTVIDLVVIFAGVGVLFTTRGAGFFVRKNGGGGGVPSSGAPYRAAEGVGR